MWGKFVGRLGFGEQHPTNCQNQMAAFAQMARQSAVAAMRTPIQDDEAMPGLLAFARICANSIALAVRDGHMDAAQVISVAVAKHLDIVDKTLAPHVVALLREAVHALGAAIEAQINKRPRLISAEAHAITRRLFAFTWLAYVYARCQRPGRPSWPHELRTRRRLGSFNVSLVSRGHRVPARQFLWPRTR